jgi:predicted N-acyltransferase
MMRHEFLLALEQSGSISAEKGWQSKHLLVFKQQELIAAMPLYLKNHSRGEYVFDQQWADAYYQSKGSLFLTRLFQLIAFTSVKLLICFTCINKPFS